MKQFFALICAVLLVAFSLCGCMDNAANQVKQTASEAISDLSGNATDYSGDNNGLLDDNREDVQPTNYAEDNTDGIYTEEGNMSTEWDNMVENGEVEDGDGNIGKLENEDGDANVDENAVE